MEKMTCPTSPLTADGEPHTIIGCGSTNVTGPDDEGLWDCLDCGIWWNPALEDEVLPETCARIEVPREGDAE
jgi:hypothetical protein